MRKLSLGAALCALALAGVQAAGVWETKPFTEWTDKDVQLVLTDSPWAGKGSLTNVRSGGNFSPTPDWKVTIAWQSALPLKQAILKQLVGPTGQPSPEQIKAVETPEATYIIRISGLPGMYGNTLAATNIGKTAQLLRDGKPPLTATQGGAQMLDKNGNIVEPQAPRGRAALSGGVQVIQVALQRGGGGGGGGFGGGGFGGGPGVKDDGSTALLVLGFPKDDPITAADKEVEFSAVVGPYYLKKKFKVKDMVLKGEPAL